MREREIDDTYAAVAEAAAAKKKARKAAHTAPALAPPLPEEEADGARGINQVRRKRAPLHVLRMTRLLLRSRIATELAGRYELRAAWSG